MKIQRRTLSIVSSMFVAGLLTLPLQAQQSNPQPSAQQSSTQQPSAQTTDTAQPQAQPAQTNTVPTNTQPDPATAQPAAPATNQAAPAQQQPATKQPAAQQPQQPSAPNSNVNPSQGPLQPVQPMTTYPDATGGQQQNVPAQGNNLPNGPQPKRPTEPVGAATAESVPTTGGAAAKPAGVAIAPAKQHQSRSLLIKVGAALAAGAALGTVYALSHGTASTPPGSGLAGVTQK